MENPKLFISYSWSSPEHEEWVLNLATNLVDSGVNVILDKWDLKEGQDSHVFMEKMVTDSEIKKVVLISDKEYAEKTNDRRGGVGTEAQIISSEIYSKQDQVKFVAVVKERDENDKVCLPAYYTSRIYIDLSDSTTYSENFERLLRWVFDQPLYKKPELGKKPIYLKNEENQFRFATSITFKRAISALKKGETISGAIVEEYLSDFSREFEKLRINEFEGEFDEEVIKNIQAFLPYRNELIELFTTISLYNIDEGILNSLRRFLERLIPFLDRTKNISSYEDWDFDNYRFIIHEIFLYLVAILVKYERFEQVNTILGSEFFVFDYLGNSDDIMVPFSKIRLPMKSLEYRNKRLELQKSSLRADLIKERNPETGLEFIYLLQADFILFIREELRVRKEYWKGGWWPETLVYLGFKNTPFEVFARSKSHHYFQKSKFLLGIEKKEQLSEILEMFEKGEKILPKWGFYSFSPKLLLGFDELDTQ